VLPRRARVRAPARGAAAGWRGAHRAARWARGVLARGVLARGSAERPVATARGDARHDATGRGRRSGMGRLPRRTRWMSSSSCDESARPPRARACAHPTRVCLSPCAAARSTMCRARPFLRISTVRAPAPASARLMRCGICRLPTKPYLHEFLAASSVAPPEGLPPVTPCCGAAASARTWPCIPRSVLFATQFSLSFEILARGRGWSAA